MRQAQGPIPERPTERRIIERTRLLERLEEANARTMLLVAPPGYGKTTLARQWLDRHHGAFLAIGPAATDLPVLARSLAEALRELGVDCTRQVEEAIHASATPSRQAQNVAKAILSQVTAPLEDWLVIDDYHALDEDSDANALLLSLERSARMRLLIAARTRPRWATARRLLYGEIFILMQDDLALDIGETTSVLAGDQRAATALRDQARGWPAVIGLAAVAGSPDWKAHHLLADTLYEYFADEIYAHVSPTTRDHLVRIALLPELNRDVLEDLLGGKRAIAAAIASGLVNQMQGYIQVHPLARDFLFAKARVRPDVSALLGAAVDFSMDHGAWDHAVALVQEFSLVDKIAELLTRAFTPLLETGRLETIKSLGTFAASHGGAPQPLLDLIDAEVARHDGLFERASYLGQVAATSLPDEHILKARGYIVAGWASYFDSQLETAYTMFVEAIQAAQSQRDVSDAAWGRCITALYLEDERMHAALAAFEAMVDVSAEDRLHVLVARLHLARLADGLFDLRADGARAHELLDLIADPLVRTGWANIYGYSLTLQARYVEARHVLQGALEDIDRFSLEFGRPHIEWSLAAAELGLRHFTRARALLSRVERTAGNTGDPYLDLNTRALRARFLLAQGRIADAIRLTSDDVAGYPSRAMYAEYLATRALALAVGGRSHDAHMAAQAALNISLSVETRVISAAAEAIAALDTPAADTLGETLLKTASELQCWDGVVAACRSSFALVEGLITHPPHRQQLKEVLLRSNDATLAHAAGLLERRPYGHHGILSQRELEVLDLLRQGLKNRQIAATLFISEATVKVHVRHIFDKLGAHTRAEAVARYAELPTLDATSSTSPASRWIGSE